VGTLTVEPRLRHTSGNAGTSSNLRYLRYWLKRQANGLTKNVRHPVQWFTRHLELANSHSRSHDSRATRRVRIQATRRAVVVHAGSATGATGRSPRRPAGTRRLARNAAARPGTGSAARSAGPGPRRIPGRCGWPYADPPYPGKALGVSRASVYRHLASVPTVEEMRAIFEPAAHRVSRAGHARPERHALHALRPGPRLPRPSARRPQERVKVERPQAEPVAERP